MPNNSYQIERIKQRLYRQNFVEKKMFGFHVFMLNDAILLGLGKNKNTGEDVLLVRIGRILVDQLISEGKCRPIDPIKNSLKAFAFVDAENFDLDSDLDFWIEKTLKFNSEL